MRHFAPIGGNHIGRCAQTSSAAEFSHDLAGGKAPFRAAWIFCISNESLHGLAVADGIVQEPATVGIQGNARIRKRFFEGTDGFYFIIARKHAAFELEVFETILFGRRTTQLHDGFWGQRFLAANTVPALGLWLAQVRQVRLIRIAHVEEVTQDGDTGALLAIAKQFGNWNAEDLAHQVQQAGLNGCDRMYANALVEGLVAASADIFARYLGAKLVEQGLVLGNGLANKKLAGFFNGLPNGFSTWNFAEANATFGVCNQCDISGEKWGMSSGKI